MESNLYRDYIDDYISVVPQAGVNMVPGVMNTNARSYQNVDARMYDGEFLVSYLFTTRLFISSDLSYTRGTRDLDSAKGGTTPDLAEIPPLCSRTLLRYDTGGFLGEVEGVFTGRQDHVDTALGEKPTAGYGIANMRAG